MSGLFDRLRNSRGESLVEVLASVLVGSLALLLLASLIAVSARITKRAEDTDAPYYEALNAAEARSGVVTGMNEDGTPIIAVPKSGEVTVTDGITTAATFDDSEFSGGEGVWSYREKTP